MIRRFLCWIGWHHWERRVWHMPVRDPVTRRWVPGYIGFVYHRCANCAAEDHLF